MDSIHHFSHTTVHITDVNCRYLIIASLMLYVYLLVYWESPTPLRTLLANTLCRFQSAPLSHHP